MVRLFLTKICYFGYVCTLLWLSWKCYSISDYNGQNHTGFLKKSVAFGVPPAYSRYRRLHPGGYICWFCVNFPRYLKCQSLSSLTVEIAFKHHKQAIKYQCWCGVNFLRIWNVKYCHHLRWKLLLSPIKKLIYIFFIVLFVLRNQNNL